MSDNRAKELSDDLVIFRLDSIETRLHELSSNIDKLANVLITKENFNELATDVRTYVRRTDQLEARVKNLENLAKILTGMFGAAMAVLIARILDLL